MFIYRSVSLLLIQQSLYKIFVPFSHCLSGSCIWPHSFGSCKHKSSFR